MIRTGLLDRSKSSLDKAGMEYIELGGVVANPRRLSFMRGIELAKSKGVEFHTHVGGGSVMELCEGNSIWRSI